MRANLFDKERSVSSYLPPVLPYLPASPDGLDGFNYEGRDGRRHGREHSYSDGYGASSDLVSGDGYGNYGSSQLGRGGPYGAYGSYASGRTSTSG
ncbi:KH domain-containing protein [Trifolium medium]|uniref:KH domain-containing protein n=1 Tax=Trifolium medium TaxID=97028 RepID=A0A392M7T8_9FABA|nr:KH domain-containing protein [Trifolium medium]